MPQSRHVPKRERIFVAAEGEGERALVRWLQELCDEQGLHLHLDIVVAGGGDTRAVVEYAVDRRRRHTESRGHDKAALVFLDADRLAQDRATGRDPDTVEGREHLQLVFLRPNLEGLLFRLHPHREAESVVGNDAGRRLEQLWPEYVKPMRAKALRQRFGIGDLQRVARHDPELRNALTLLGLLPRT